MIWSHLPFQMDGLYYIGTLLVGLLAFTGMRVFKKSMFRCLAMAACAAYMFFSLSVTIFSRGPTDHPFNWFPPFWAYKEIFKGSSIAGRLAKQILVNIFMLAPLGVLIPVATDRNPLPIGIAFSFSIESLQFLTKKGYFELDDLIHNTIGVCIGYLFYRFIKKFFPSDGDS